MTSSSRPPRIIVADDHEWIRRILVEVVHQTLPAAEIVETQDGAKAWEAYQEAGCDFLVSNHCMPNLDGNELIRRVRAQEPGLPVVMVSVKPEARNEAMAAGANWFLTKTQIMEQLPRLLLQHTRKAPGGNN